MRSVKEQMKEIKDRGVIRMANGLPASPMGWERDGGDHINVASAGATQLGRALSLRYNRRFMHPLLGSFASMNNIWYFLLAKTPSDNVRMLNDHARLTELIKRTGGERRFVENFRAMLIHSVWVMLLNHPDLMRMMAESSLPFDCYRRMAAKALPERFKFTSWFVEGLNEVRTAIKERRQPNLEAFMDRTTRGQENPYIYWEVIEYITGNPLNVHDRVDFGAYNESSWAAYDKFIAQEAAQKANKASPKAKPEKKKFKVKDIDAMEDSQATCSVAQAEAAPVEQGDMPVLALDTPASETAEVAVEVDAGEPATEATLAVDIDPASGSGETVVTAYHEEAHVVSDVNVPSEAVEAQSDAEDEGVVHSV